MLHMPAVIQDAPDRPALWQKLQGTFFEGGDLRWRERRTPVRFALLVVEGGTTG